MIQIRRFGFLHLCSEEIFSEGLNVGQPKISRANFDEIHEKGLKCSNYWWRGYSPLTEKFSTNGTHIPDQLNINWTSYWDQATVRHDKIVYHDSLFFFRITKITSTVYSMLYLYLRMTRGFKSILIVLNAYFPCLLTLF